MGYFVENAGLGGVLAGVQRTGSILGAKMKNTGSGYRFPPIVNFRDKCNLGYGAVGQAILGGPNDDEVIAIVMLTTGESYPITPTEDNPNDDGIVKIIVTNPGSGYVPGTDRVTIPGISDDGLVFIDLPEGPEYSFEDGKDVPIGIGAPSPIYDIVTDDNGGILEVKVLNILRFDETLPEFRILSETGSGAILKAGFGKIPTGTGQVGIISAIDCIRSIPSSEGV
jgi:hypothetical protein